MPVKPAAVVLTATTLAVSPASTTAASLAHLRWRATVASKMRKCPAIWGKQTKTLV